MSRPSSSLIQDQEAIYDSIGPQGLPTASHYSSPGHTSAPPYSFPLHSNPPYNPQPSPVRKFSPSNNAVSSSTPQYMSPPSQYIPVHHNSMASPPPNYMSSASQYISAPCTVTASPISQVGHLSFLFSLSQNIPQQWLTTYKHLTFGYFLQFGLIQLSNGTIHVMLSVATNKK